MLDPSDTIVAIASHPGPAARGLVRLSGPDALRIALSGFEGEGATPTPFVATSYVGRLRLDDGRAWRSDSPGATPHPDPPPQGGRGPELPPAPISRVPATLVLWPGPRSYTGQPVAEIHTIGSPPILGAIVSRCLALGARAAEPGEFTLRAFLSGRIDLTQSEAVLGVIEARDPAQLDVALRQLAGGLASPIRDLRDLLLDRLVEIEANLDFVDESDVAPVVRRALLEALADSLARLDDLIARYGSRDRSETRPRVVLVGRPNAGKSRLFNALLGDDRAIVSPVAGTTRDYLVGPCDCDGLPVELVDTAGEDDAASAIDLAAQAGRASESARADLVLACVPSDEAGGSSPSIDDRTLIVYTKADLAPSSGLATSALTGLGLDALRSGIATRLRAARAGGTVQELGSHCREGLDRAREALASALAIAGEPGGEELIAVELRQVVDELGRLVGAVVTEDILDRIFRRFCIGK